MSGHYENFAVSNDQVFLLFRIFKIRFMLREGGYYACCQDVPVLKNESIHLLYRPMYRPHLNYTTLFHHTNGSKKNIKNI